MREFITRYAGVILGVLSGFDRLLFRGSLRNLSYEDGLFKFLNWQGVKLVQFKAFCESVTDDVKNTAETLAKETGCPSIYLPSSQVPKETIARHYATQDLPRGPQGLVCILRAVEPCLSWQLHKNRDTQRLELQMAHRKCLHYYYYFQHPQFGWMHIRVQSWLPLMVRICLNGREWLANQMTGAGITFQQRENSFLQISDFEGAQRLADLQRRTEWVPTLNELLALVHPPQSQLYPEGWPYYWSAEQTELATDILFKTPEALQACYPHFLRHAAFDVSSADVLRFLGKSLKQNGEFRADFSGDVQSHLGTRPEGTRIKHLCNANWLKMYDKWLQILRIETTINNTREFKVFRTAENDPDGELAWRILRKGVADLARRAEVSQAANNRYLQRLAAVETPQTLAEAVEPICRRVRCNNRSVRALNPLAANDAQLLEVVSKGEFSLNGFRNADVRVLLYGVPAKEKDPETRKQAAAVTRKLQLLRSHGLIQKVQKTHRYTVTEKGATIITALLTARRASTAKQTQLSA